MKPRQQQGFNPSSNGNGAGIDCESVAKSNIDSFNPSSNGNGAGIRTILTTLLLIILVSILLLMEMVLELPQNHC